MCRPHALHCMITPRTSHIMHQLDARRLTGQEVLGGSMYRCSHSGVMQGFPSIGDVQSTVPVPKEKWFEYAGERSGRFQVRRALMFASSMLGCCNADAW